MESITLDNLANLGILGGIGKPGNPNYTTIAEGLIGYNQSVPGV